MKRLKILGVLVTVLLMVQCQDESIEDSQQAKDPIPEEIMKGLSNLNFNTKDFEVLKTKGGYLVEGDINIPAKTIIAAATETTKQRRTTTLMNCSEARDVTVRNNIPEIDREVRSAINDWNSVGGGSFLRFRVVTRGTADININFMAGNLGDAFLPFNGRPGSRVRIDPSLYDPIRNRTSRSRVIQFVLTHELGHTIGLHHTNTQDGVFLAGTNQNDALSVMNNQSGPVTTWQSNRKSAGDRVAVRALYNSRGDDLCI